MYKIIFRYQKESRWKYLYARDASELQEDMQSLLSLYVEGVYTWRVMHV